MGGWVEQQKGEENRNSTTARIVLAICMKMNGGNSPNPGKLLFLPRPGGELIYRQECRRTGAVVPRGRRKKTLERPYSNGCFFTLLSARVSGGMRTMPHTPITHRPIKLESGLEPRSRHRANLILALFPPRNRISLKTNAKLDSNPHTQGIFRRREARRPPGKFRECYLLRLEIASRSKQTPNSVLNRTIKPF